MLDYDSGSVLGYDNVCFYFDKCNVQDNDIVYVMDYDNDKHLIRLMLSKYLLFTFILKTCVFFKWERSNVLTMK